MAGRLPALLTRAERLGASVAATALVAAVATAASALLGACGGGSDNAVVLSGSTISSAPAGATSAPVVTPPGPPTPPASAPSTPPVDPTPPTVTAFAAAASGITPQLVGGSLAVTADGNVWFSGGSEVMRVGRMSAAGVVSYPVTAPSLPASAVAGPLAVGPDGNVWFADPVAGTRLSGALGRIDRVTGVAVELSTPLMQTTVQATTGKPPVTTTIAVDTCAASTATTTATNNGITTTTLTTVTCSGITPGAQAYVVTAGPDGNVWFTEYTRAALGKLDLATGLVREYGPLAAPAVAISAGPDGNVWFVENLAAAAPVIGRITPAGTITEFSTGLAPGMVLGSPVAGADGGVWFVKSGTGGTAIGRIDPASGTIVFHSAGLFGPEPLIAGLALGADGNLWFTDYYQGLLGRITPNGSIAEFGQVTGGTPVNAIAASPAGSGSRAVWFSDPANLRLGRATLP